MRRTSFDRESRLLGRDFSALIDREGGKSAGLHLLEAGIKRFVQQRRLRTGRRALGTVPWHTIPTETYEAAENILREQFKCLNDEEVWQLVYSECELLKYPKIKKFIQSIVQECQEAFPEPYQDSLQAGAPADAVPFHLRSSTTIEDFRDDRYFGTFLSKGDDGFFFPYEDGSCWGSQNLLEVLTNFYAMKFHSGGRFQLDEKEKLAMILMPTASRYRDNSVIAYSSYPEDASAPAVMEAWEVLSMEGMKPLQYMRMNQRGELEITPMTVERDKEGKPLTHSACKPVVGEDDRNIIYSLSKAFEEELEYPVNLEVVISDEGVIPVQLRPVPYLPENREVRKLSPVQDDSYVIAETPFVRGSFRKTARLVMPHYKNDYPSHKFNEPVIVWHSDSHKGQRFYFSDDNCVAMLNPEEGAALSHDSSLLPAFGKERDRFAFIGVSIPGFKEKLKACMSVVEEPVGTGKAGKFSYTPFPLTIESDGRRGRVSVQRADARYFE